MRLMEMTRKWMLKHWTSLVLLVSLVAYEICIFVIPLYLSDVVRRHATVHALGMGAVFIFGFVPLILDGTISALWLKKRLFVEGDAVEVSVLENYLGGISNLVVLTGVVAPLDSPTDGRRYIFTTISSVKLPIRIGVEVIRVPIASIRVK